MSVDLTLHTGLAALWVLLLCRTSGMLLIVPVFGGRVVPLRIRAALAILVATVLYLARPASPLVNLGFDPALALLAIREVLAGLFLGLLVRLMFLAFRFAGEVIGHEMGFGIARIVDPQSGQSSALLSEVFELFGLMLFLGLNGHHHVLLILQKSFSLAPAGRAAGLGDWLGWFLAYFRDILLGSVVLVAPVYVLLLAGTVAVGILTKAVPQIHMLDFAFPARILVAILALALFLPTVAQGMERVFERGYTRILQYMATW